MPEIKEPDLHVIRFSDVGDAERRAERERVRQEARGRYVAHVAAVLAELDQRGSLADRARGIVDHLLEWNRVTSGDPCLCGCHPRLPTSDFHDFGFACPCRMSAEQRDALIAEHDAFWSTAEGQAIIDAEEAEKQELAAWLAVHPGVTVQSRGGWAPEQWTGTVDGHSFYFRERHDHWHIELDLRPTGRYSTVWVGGEFDETNFENREIEAGDIIAEGTTAVASYGDSPVTRLEFIVKTIRAHLCGRACVVHTTERSAVEEALGWPIAWCPSCGEEVDRT